MVSAVGVPTLAAWAIAHRICDFAPIPSTGLIRTTSATVGQNLGADGMWLAPALGWILQAALMGLRFRQGRWKLKPV